MERSLGLFAGLALMVCVTDEMKNGTDRGRQEVLYTHFFSANRY